MLADDEAEAEAEASSESFSRSESVTTAIRPERRAQFGHRGERQPLQTEREVEAWTDDSPTPSSLAMMPENEHGTPTVLSDRERPPIAV